MTIERPMFPPIDPTRRRFLTVAAIGSMVGAGSLAAVAMNFAVMQLAKMLQDFNFFEGCIGLEGMHNFSVMAQVFAKWGK